MSQVYCLLVVAAACLRLGETGHVDNKCLRCICEATGCDFTQPCERDVCGGFKMTEQYFRSSNVTALGSFRNTGYKACASYPICASAAVRLYLERFGRDCDADHMLTCDDLLLVHHVGAKACTRSAWVKWSQLWENYNRCYSRFRQPSDT